MFSKVVTLVVLTALAGCNVQSFDLNDDDVGGPNGTLIPILPKDVTFIPQEASTLIPILPKVVGPPCGSPAASVSIPAGGSVTFTSPNPPTKDIRANSTAGCGWAFTTVPDSTLSLTCQSFSLSGPDMLSVLALGGSSPSIYEYRGTSFPSSRPLDAQTVSVLFHYRTTGDRGYFSCTITASGGTEAASLTAKAVTPCRCGVVNRSVRITGGVDTQVNEYPWQVGIMYTTSRFVFCGGSLISNRFVITAAHCMKGRRTSTFRLLLGGHTKNQAMTTETIVNPIRIITHPSYQVGNSQDNDYSIIEIAPLNFLDPLTRVRPICLPNSGDLYAGAIATATGWGTLVLGGAQPNILQEVNIPVVTNAYCASVYGSIITSNMICAGTTAGGKDTCQGDSGGPLIAPDGANYELIGVTSFGYGCGLPQVPGVYARVTARQSWIMSTIAGSTMCGR